MATEWKKVKLQEICESISDGDHLPPPKVENGIPFVTISNIKDNQLDFTDTMFVPETYYEKLDNKRKAKTGDILYSVVGSFGIPVLLKRNEKFVFQRHIAILRPNKIDSSFLYYTMLGRDFYAKADAAAIGAAQRTVSLTSLRNIEICLPPLETQQKIAGILSAYDDLIENNRKQIKLLEEAAQKLYKEWFVKLNFPGHENVKIVDGVPEGWKKEKVGNIIKTLPKTKQVKTAETLSNGEIPVIDQSRDFIAGYTNDKETIIKSETPVIVFGDHTRILKLIQFPFARGADGTQVFISINNCIKEYQLYCALVEIDLSNYSYARHFKYLKEQEILIPTKELSEVFEVFVESNYQLIQKLRNKIQLLQSARDKLLPTLMKGDIDV